MGPPFYHTSATGRGRSGDDEEKQDTRDHSNSYDGADLSRAQGLDELLRLLSRVRVPGERAAACRKKKCIIRISIFSLIAFVLNVAH